MQGGLELSEDAVPLRKQIINMVLGTDMKKHFDIVSRFQVALALSSQLSAQQIAHWVVHACMTDVLSQPLCLSALPNICTCSHT